MQPQTELLPAWLSIAEVAEYANVSRDVIRDLVSSGELRASRVGKRLIRISRSDVEQMMQPVTSIQSELDRQAG